MDRRKFFKNSLFAGLSLCSLPLLKAQNSEKKKPFKFKMNFTARITQPIFQTSAGKDLLKRMDFFADKGFRSIEMGVVPKSQAELLSKIGEKAKALGLEAACTSAMNEKDFATMTAFEIPRPKGEKPARDKALLQAHLLKQLQETSDVLKRLGSSKFIVGPGLEAKDLPKEVQFENTVENMKFCAKYCEENNITMLLEPLNTKTHPGQFCTNAEMGARIVRAIGSKKCELLFDVFHEQVQMGNWNSLDSVFDTIGHVHIADAPARQEPGTGVIDFAAFFKKLWDKGYRGCIGLEFNQSKQDAETDAKILASLMAFDELVK